MALIRASLLRALPLSAALLAPLSAALLAGALAPCFGQNGNRAPASQSPANQPPANPLPAKATQDLPPALLAELQQKHMPRHSPIVLRVFKEESELEVWKQDTTGRFALLKTYPVCRWSGDLGPKLHEGDRQAPEGFYTVTPAQMNPNSAFYLSINTGFPNSFDKANERDGTFLMIHGDCLSIGCFAMTDEGISEIYALAREAFAGRPSFQVQAYPFRMTPENLARHRTSPNLGFWMMLKTGNDHFEATHLEPKVDVCDRGYVFDAVEPPHAAKPLAFDPVGKCPAFVVNPKIAGPAAEKERADDAAYARLVEQNVPVAPVYSGLDGDMNKVFAGRFPGRYVSFAKVLPPSGPELPLLPPVPWADNGHSLTTKFFGGLFGAKSGAQTQTGTQTGAQAAAQVTQNFADDPRH